MFTAYVSQEPSAVSEGTSLHAAGVRLWGEEGRMRERMGEENQPISSRIALYAGIFSCVLRVGLWCGVLLDDVGGSYHFIGWGLFAMFTCCVWFRGVTFFPFLVVFVSLTLLFRVSSFGCCS